MGSWKKAGVSVLLVFASVPALLLLIALIIPNFVISTAFSVVKMFLEETSKFLRGEPNA